MSEASADEGGDSARWGLDEEMELRFADLDADADEEDLAVVCLTLPLALGPVDGPALDEGVRLGGLKGSLRFFCAGGSPAMVMCRLSRLRM